MKLNITDLFYSWALGKRKEIIWSFFAVYGVLVLLLLVGGLSVYRRDDNLLFFHEAGKLCGEFALADFVFVLIPGIARRLNIKHKLISLLRIYRRYLGILMFMLVLTHAGIVAIVPRFHTWPNIFTFQAFEWWGLAAFTILFFMFLTSNDLSLSMLKIWWYRLHRLVYAVMFFVLIHTGLQEIGTWSVIAGLLIIVMGWSFVYEYLRKKDAIRKTSSAVQTPPAATDKAAP